MKEITKKIEPGKIELFLFDLDGTLYEDQDHFDYYAECLARNLKPEKRNLFWKDLIAARQGEHVLRLGRVYDLEKDLILEIERDRRIKRAWTWEGQALEKSRIEAFYPYPARCNMENMLYMGDGWWLPAACAFHYGLKDPGYCYQKTKQWLGEKDQSLQPIPGLAENLSLISEIYPLVLATNSDQENTERLLKLLGLEKIFHSVFTCCEKPAGTELLVKKIEEEFAIPPRGIISIGDNFLNEIGPLRDSGAQSILIDPHGIFCENRDTGPLVRSIREIFPLFNYLRLD